MSEFSLSARAAVVVALIVCALPGAVSGGRLEGRWRLVEDSYGDGRGNLVARGSDVVLAIEAGAGGLDVRSGLAGSDDPGQPWPVVIDSSGVVEIEVLGREIDGTAGRIRARYRVPAPSADALEIELIEDYELSADGEALVGTMTVRMTRGGEPRGGYVLHRRFERSR